MSDDHGLGEAQELLSDEVAFDYVKSQDFHVVWADGAIGSPTPSGLIHFALYAERPAIPRRQVFALNKTSENTGTIGPEIFEKQISRGSIVREMSCDVFLTVDAAENLAKWLLRVTEDLKKSRGQK